MTREQAKVDREIGQLYDEQYELECQIKELQLKLADVNFELRLAEDYAKELEKEARAEARKEALEVSHAVLY